MTFLEPRLLASPTSPSLGALFCDRRTISLCLGEAIEAVSQGGDWARPQIDQLNARLDAIEAEISQRSESEWSAYDVQRYLREKGR
ncbi:MAG: hypothetical protein JWQ89_4572 [Devosia sp.]|uniref:hypothetical protein n=1 Tax=Devosia sp. TaxID=1871048 RepID=UPI0026042C9D|nr:hypothetical protein [Devosia sp.]MDB5542845.1 hypothetical protein [Devosia sp.]